MQQIRAAQLVRTPLRVSTSLRTEHQRVDVQIQDASVSLQTLYILLMVAHRIPAHMDVTLVMVEQAVRFVELILMTL